MRRPTCFRMFAATWALWFAAVLSEPAALHVCSMHAPAHGTSPAQGLAPSTAHSHARAQTEDGAPADVPVSKHGACSCIGGCCAVTVVALPSAPTLRDVPMTSTSVSAISSPAAHYRPTTPPYARPPSHAPPFSKA